MDDITLTKEEAMAILRSLNQIEGYLYSIKDNSKAIDILDYPVEILSNKIIGG